MKRIIIWSSLFIATSLFADGYDGYNSLFIGNGAGFDLRRSSSYSVVIGNQAAKEGYKVDSSVIVGAGAGMNFGSGINGSVSNCVFIGAEEGLYNTNVYGITSINGRQIYIREDEDELAIRTKRNGPLTNSVIWYKDGVLHLNATNIEGNVSTDDGRYVERDVGGGLSPFRPDYILEITNYFPACGTNFNNGQTWHSETSKNNRIIFSYDTKAKKIKSIKFSHDFEHIEKYHKSWGWVDWDYSIVHKEVSIPFYSSGFNYVTVEDGTIKYSGGGSEMTFYSAFVKPGIPVYFYELEIGVAHFISYEEAVSKTKIAINKEVDEIPNRDHEFSFVTSKGVHDGINNVIDNQFSGLHLDLNKDVVLHFDYDLYWGTTNIFSGIDLVFRAKYELKQAMSSFEPDKDGYYAFSDAIVNCRNILRCINYSGFPPEAVREDGSLENDYIVYYNNDHKYELWAYPEYNFTPSENGTTVHIDFFVDEYTNNVAKVEHQKIGEFNASGVKVRPNVGVSEVPDSEISKTCIATTKNLYESTRSTRHIINSSGYIALREKNTLPYSGTPCRSSIYWSVSNVNDTVDMENELYCSNFRISIEESSGAFKDNFDYKIGDHLQYEFSHIHEWKPSYSSPSSNEIIVVTGMVYSSGSKLYHKLMCDGHRYNSSFTPDYTIYHNEKIFSYDIPMVQLEHYQNPVDYEISKGCLSSTKYVDTRLGGMAFKFEDSTINVYSNGVKVGTLSFTPSN